MTDEDTNLTVDERLDLAESTISTLDYLLKFGSMPINWDVDEDDDVEEPINGYEECIARAQRVIADYYKERTIQPPPCTYEFPVT